MGSTGDIDIHAHYYPERYVQLFIEDGERHGARYAAGTSGPLIHVPGDIPSGPITPEFTDLDLRLAAMDRQGVQWQALSLTQPKCILVPFPPGGAADTIGHSPAVLRFLLDAVGSDRVMLGSDYCFKMGLERPVDTLMGVPGLDDEDRERILKGTASRLLRIGAA